ncbi:hypothetical protein [Umezawaea sp. Da 62-37]|uniref:hypothetical protein n=1 Tax=Umezawaea sp. Da 62-37 TaxID=3075927 RepID=UPI0028F6C797|nr:hypothetical protein [Umezawaea sp. Da 62-37]WNV83549.1 hypothetical protein RM788_35990 [Umezawaea sp. Da 62-37]
MAFSASRARALLVVAIVATFLTGLAQVVQPVGASTPPPAAAPDVRSHAVRDLLDHRAAALRARDEPAFLATVDPTDQAFLDRQRTLFRNLAGVPLAEWDYLVDPVDQTTPTTRPAADELWAPGVRLRYRLDGVDAEPSTRPMGYLFARHGDHWLLASDTAAGETWRGPWDFAPCHVLTSPSGLVLSHPGGEALAARVLAELDSAVTTVTEVWGPAWPRQVAVIVPADQEEMRSLVGPAFAVGSIAGVAVADQIDPVARTARGQRVVLNPDSATALSPLSLRVLLRHEITHVAARGETADSAPMWLLEGFADYVGFRGTDVPTAKAAPALAALVARSGPPEALPTDTDFRGPAMDLAYQEAWSINRYLAGLLGEAGLVRLYRALAAEKSDVDGVLRSIAGVDRAGLTKGWREFLRTDFFR